MRALQINTCKYSATAKVFAFGFLLITAEVSVFVSTARSSFFDVSTRAVDSPDPLKEAKEGIEGDGSCPVLPGDTPAEAVTANQSLLVALISFLLISIVLLFIINVKLPCVGHNTNLFFCMCRSVISAVKSLNSSGRRQMKNGTTNLLCELMARQVYSNRANLPASCHFCGSKQATRGRGKGDFHFHSVCLPASCFHISFRCDFSRLHQMKSLLTGYNRAE